MRRQDTKGKSVMREQKRRVRGEKNEEVGEGRMREQRNNKTGE